MSLRERLERMEPRERQLLGIFGVLFVVFVLVLVPVAITAFVGSKRSEVAELRAAIEEIQSGRAQVERRDAERRAVLARYQSPAPPLAGFLETRAQSAQLEIPESQDRALVPHGKRYEERSTKIVLRKVGMLNLSKFMEGIEQSGHPVSISRLNIRKRGTEQDSYDVEMFVSAYDRKAEERRKPAQTDEEAAQ
ncbi:MAG: type II secretion system protein M [Polyangiaceae bacterium]|nr:type II secretion system protein M [Polyangiaceae bacterium]